MLCKIKKFLPWVAVLLWMILIFYLAHQSAVESAEVSTGLLDKIFALFGNIIDHNTLRKLAHAFEYFMLCLLIFNALWRTTKKQKMKISSVSLASCLIYAISDEIHQIFIPGRAGRVFDVGVDMAGAVLGLVFCLLVLFIFSKFHSDKTQKEL